MLVRRPQSLRLGRILGELLLIIVGINIALWFEGLVEDRREARLERQYLAGLAEDLTLDIANLAETIRFNVGKLDQVKKAQARLDGLADETPDVQQAVVFTPSSYLTFEPSDFTYQAMQQSGDFHLISDAEIKSDLLRLMRRYRNIDTLQDNFLEAMDQGFIPITMLAFDLEAGRLANPDFVNDWRFRNFYVYTLQDTEGMVASYRRAADTAKGLLRRVEDALAD